MCIFWSFWARCICTLAWGRAFFVEVGVQISRERPCLRTQRAQGSNILSRSLNPNTFGAGPLHLGGLGVAALPNLSQSPPFRAPGWNNLWEWPTRSNNIVLFRRRFVLLHLGLSLVCHVFVSCAALFRWFCQCFALSSIDFYLGMNLSKGLSAFGELFFVENQLCSFFVFIHHMHNPKTYEQWIWDPRWSLKSCRFL